MVAPRGPVPADRTEVDDQPLDAAVAERQDERAAGPGPRAARLPRERVVAGPLVELQPVLGLGWATSRRVARMTAVDLHAARRTVGEHVETLVAAERERDRHDAARADDAAVMD